MGTIYKSKILDEDEPRMSGGTSAASTLKRASSSLRPCCRRVIELRGWARMTAAGIPQCRLLTNNAVSNHLLRRTKGITKPSKDEGGNRWPVVGHNNSDGQGESPITDDEKRLRCRWVRCRPGPGLPETKCNSCELGSGTKFNYERRGIGPTLGLAGPTAAVCRGDSIRARWKTCLVSIYVRSTATASTLQSTSCLLSETSVLGSVQVPGRGRVSGTVPYSPRSIPRGADCTHTCAVDHSTTLASLLALSLSLRSLYLAFIHHRVVLLGPARSRLHRSRGKCALQIYGCGFPAITGPFAVATGISVVQERKYHGSSSLTVPFLSWLRNRRTNEPSQPKSCCLTDTDPPTGERRQKHPTGKRKDRPVAKRSIDGGEGWNGHAERRNAGRNRELKPPPKLRGRAWCGGRRPVTLNSLIGLSPSLFLSLAQWAQVH
ncbi:hypothetical protein J6590_003769 [Homalodisca vitripennis]|nr:hypothetical protein J6590_003769 [Homalodisca vitripennis]